MNVHTAKEKEIGVCVPTIQIATSSCQLNAILHVINRIEAPLRRRKRRDERETEKKKKN